MATGHYDDQGVWIYGEDDELYPFSTFMNKGQESISEQLGYIRDVFGLAWHPYVPGLTASSTNPSLGTGARVLGRWQQMGTVIVAWAEITFGTSGTAAGNGTYYVHLPTIARTPDALTVVGTAWLYDATGAVHAGYLQCDSTTGNYRARIYPANAANNLPVSHNAPFAWGPNDGLRIMLTYEDGTVIA